MTKTKVTFFIWCRAEMPNISKTAGDAI